jgi:hypothetical protein
MAMKKSMRKVVATAKKKFNGKISPAVFNKKGMEMVQVAILVAIAVAVGIIFKSSVVDFVNRIFGNLDAANF